MSSGDIDGLIKRLELLGGNVTGALLRGVHEFDSRVQMDAKANSPTQTGRLKNSIVTEEKRDGGDIIGRTGTNVSYAPFVELGTGPKGAKSGIKLPPGVTVRYRTKGWGYIDEQGNKRFTQGQAAIPFLYPAFEQNAPDAVSIIAKELEKTIKEL